jgi:hypothetical protein
MVDWENSIYNVEFQSPFFNPPLSNLFDRPFCSVFNLSCDIPEFEEFENVFL